MKKKRIPLITFGNEPTFLKSEFEYFKGFSDFKENRFLAIFALKDKHTPDPSIELLRISERSKEIRRSERIMLPL